MKSFSALPGIVRKFVGFNNLFVSHCFKICRISRKPCSNTRVIWGVIQQRYCYQQSQVMLKLGIVCYTLLSWVRLLVSRWNDYAGAEPNLCKLRKRTGERGNLWDGVPCSLVRISLPTLRKCVLPSSWRWWVIEELITLMGSSHLQSVLKLVSDDTAQSYSHFYTRRHEYLKTQKEWCLHTPLTKHNPGGMWKLCWW